MTATVISFLFYQIQKFLTAIRKAGHAAGMYVIGDGSSRLRVHASRPFFAIRQLTLIISIPLTGLEYYLLTGEKLD